MYICIYIYIYYFMFNIGFTGFGFWKYIQVIFYIGHYHHIILYELYAQTPVLQIKLLHKHLILRYAQHNNFVAQKWLIMSCKNYNILKQDVYYKIMAGITCFCCTNRKFFSMRQSLRPHMQYILCTCCLNIQHYISAMNTDSWRGGKLHCQKNYRMVLMLCSFSFVIHDK